MAGYGTAICKVPPLLLCNPNEATSLTFDGDAYIGKSVLLTPPPGGNGAWGPGNFGFLSVGSGAADVKNAMIRALRAGHPVISAVNLVTQEMPDPIGSEFGLVMDETTYGGEFRDALRSLARRTGSADIAFFAVSIAIQTETGGNLAEILSGLATVIRGRASLNKRIRALSSEGRMSALILSLLPLVCVSAVSLFHPEFYTSKFSDPAFWPIVAGIVLLYGVGQLMIRRIVTFRY